MAVKHSEEHAAEVRNRLLRIWDGDAAASDEQIRALMELIETTEEDIPKWVRTRMLRKLAMLIQR